MNDKIFETGIVIGRFQPLHLGHEKLIDTLIKMTNNPIVIIGSSDKWGTEQNPFTAQEREEFLRKVYGDKISVYHLRDRKAVVNDESWGLYVFEHLKNDLNVKPDLYITGTEAIRTDWFSDGILNQLSVLAIAKDIIDISATCLRRAISERDICTWKKYTDKKLWDDFEKMYQVISETKGKG